jgi:AcrR family transcriptional regulator
MAATRELSLTVGYDALSIEAIAAAAGVGKQTIYRWWPSKGEVVLEMWAGQPELQGEFSDTGDLAADMKTQLRGIIGLADNAAVSRSLRGLIGASQHDPALSKELLERIVGPRIEACKRRLVRAQEAGQLDPDADLDLAVDLFYGGYYHRLLLQVAPLTADYADQIIDAALAGLRPPS